MDAPAATELVAVVSVLALGAARIVLAIRWLWLRRDTRSKVQING